MTIEKLSDLGEFGLIRRLQQQAGGREDLVRGIGDDCAIQRQDSARELLTSTDLLIEGVHFDRRWTGMEPLGRKCVAVNISDIAAMGGVPKTLFLGVACPPTISVAELEQFTRGFLAEAQKYGAVLAGGDTCASPGPLMISVTVQGDIACGKALCRDGAGAGEAIYVSGTLGDSALALTLLQAGKGPDPQLLSRHLTPAARVDLGRQLSDRQLATAMLDISDGLLSDLGHILAASGLGAELELAALPLSGPFSKVLREDPTLIDLALAGGEDYELLFTSPRQDLARAAGLVPAVTRIGNIVPREGLQIRCRDNSLYHCSRKGFDHFS